MEKKIFNPCEWLQTQPQINIPEPSARASSPLQGVPEYPGSCPHETESGAGINNNIKSDVEQTIPLPGFVPHETKSPGFMSHQTECRTNIDKNDVEQLIQQLEATQTDITSSYAQWRDIGFALAHGFGEEGRDFFHRVSRFHADYAPSACDNQYTNCLKSTGQGITLKTFFYHARQACIKKPRSTAEMVIGEPQSALPALPDTLFPQLPQFLQQVVNVATAKEERDILLLGSLVALSACFPNLFGIYDGKKVSSNLYLFVTAMASAGKGRLVHCRQLVAPIHKHLREQAKLLKREYDLQTAEFNQSKGKENGADKPAKPPEKMLFIPANSSSTGVFQLLFENEGRGLIFETEGDTLAQIFKSDYGNYSDGFRKAFHHETISYYRRTDREYVDIESPSLSAVLSGTPMQIASLIPNSENGLFSRFIFYYMDMKPVWKNVFSFSADNTLDNYFNNLGEKFYHLFQMLVSGPEIHFTFTKQQEAQFNDFFGQVQETYLSLQGVDYMATVRRLGLVAFRIAMIMSALRIMDDGEVHEKISCNNEDFQTTLQIIKVLVKHASKVFSELPEQTRMPKRLNQKERFLNGLSKEFSRQQYLQVASSLNIPAKTSEKYISDFCSNGLVHHDKKDHYIKCMD